MPFDLSSSQIAGCLLIFMRIGAIMISAPIFSSPRVPLQLRAGISLLLAFLLQPLVAPDGPSISSMPIFVLLIIREVIVGLIIGYIANIIFSIVEMAGEIQDTQAGFGFAGVVDPTMERPGAIIGQFQMVLMWLIFLAVNGHLLLMQAIADSFAIIPIGRFDFSPAMTQNMVHLAVTAMFIALRIGAPVLAAVLLSDLALGMLQRTAPQLNIIAVGFPVKIAVAILVLSLSLPFMSGAMRDTVNSMTHNVHAMLGW